MIIDGQKNYKKTRVQNHLWMLTWYIDLIITQLLNIRKMNGFTTLLYILVLAGLSEHRSTDNGTYPDI